MIEKILSSFFGNIGIVLLLITIVCFIIPISVVLFRRAKREKNMEILNKDNIITDSKMFIRLLAGLFLIFIFIVGLILIFLALNTTEVLFNMVVGSVFGCLICIISIIIIINILKEYVRVISGQYVIVIDELSDKHYYKEWGSNSDSIDYSRWQLYFKDYFKKYNKYVSTKDKKAGSEFSIGDKFYLVFIKGNSDPYIFPTKNFTLADSEKSRLKTLDEAKEDIQLKEYVLENSSVQKEKIVINKERIKKDFAKLGHLRTAIIYIFICAFLIAFMLMSIFYFKNLTGTIVISIMLVLFGFLTTVKFKYVLEINRNINKGNIKVKQDEVISLNNLIEYRDSNRMISFKFKEYKKIVFADKSEYFDTKIGDKFYLVFIKGEEEPIKVYNFKNSILDNELNIK